MKKRLIFLIINSAFFILNSVCIAQNRAIDSLLNLISKDQPDTNKVNHLNKLSSEFIKIGEYNSGLEFGNKALALTRSIPIPGDKINRRGWDKGIASAYSNIGIIYFNQGSYSQALKNFQLSLKIRIEIGDKYGIAESYNYMGNIYKYLGNYAEALKNYQISLKIREGIKDKKGIATSFSDIGAIYHAQGNFSDALANQLAALKIREEINDKQGIAKSYNNIGAIYSFQRNFSEALKNHFASLKIKEEIGDKLGIASSYNNIGNVYIRQGNYSEALKNHLASLKIREAMNDKQGIANSYYNIGGIYFSQSNFTEALKNYFASLKIKIDIGDKQGIADSFYNLGGIQVKLKKYKSSSDYLNKALQLCSEIGYKERIKDCYSLLAVLDSTQSNWKAAYFHHKLFIIYRDSLDNEETKKKIIESSMTYEFDKKESAIKAEQEKKDAIAEANKKRQQIVLILVSCVLLLVFVFAGFVVRSLRITQKQKKIIELQKNEVFLQKELVSEKNKEITDSINYAKRIQRALLASDKMLKANLNYFIFFQPKDIVSGDFYWAAQLANGNFAIATADSTGHGVPGAIMSMLNISCLNEAVKGKQLTAPNEILNYTRSKIIEQLSNDGSAEGGKDGMDCSLLSFDDGEQGSAPQLSTFDSQLLTKLTYSSANNPIWIVRNKQIIELEPDKMPVGKHERDKISFTQHTIELHKNDTIYTITDGFADQFGGPKGKKFMAKALKEFLINISHLPMNEQKERLTAEFNSWKGNLEQVDDATVIGFHI